MNERIITSNECVAEGIAFLSNKGALTPRNPITAEPIRTLVNFSDKNNGANIATQIGTENSNANN